MQLSALLEMPFAPPSVPRVVALLLSELDRDEPDLMRITQMVATDPSLTARLLQVANAGFFQLSGRIHSVSEALAVVSLRHVRAMATGAAGSTSVTALAGLELPVYWRFCQDVAKVARSLAGAIRQHQHAAYTAGMLHLIGELALRQAMPTVLGTIDQDVMPLDVRRARAERKALGYSFAQVGAAMARRWLLPDAIADALDQQETPFQDGAYEPLAGLVHLAAWRVRSRDAGYNQRQMAVTFPGQVGEVLGLDIDMVLQQDPFDWPSMASA